MNEEEIWKPIDGYEGYEVSNQGRVRSLDRVVEYSNGKKVLYKGQIMRQRCNENGYPMVGLRQKGPQKRFSVHRLVAQAFVENPNPSEFTEVNHKDEIKTNNKADNLEWCSRSYNVNYGTCIQRMVEKQSKAVCGYTEIGEVVIRFKSAHEAERFGFIRKKISACCVGRRHSHRGLFWCFAEDEDKIVPRELPRKYSMPVVAYNDNGLIVHRFDSSNEADKYGFDHRSISQCCRGRLKTHRGLHWRYA